MAVKISCENPTSLLESIKKEIHAGTIQTWELDGDGDFTHSPEQWKNLAWFHPGIKNGELVFFILGQKSKKMSKAVYGVYHGRFIEMLLTHFDTKFTLATATAMVIAGDKVGGSNE